MPHINIDSKAISHEVLANEVFRLAKEFINAAEVIDRGPASPNALDIDSQDMTSYYHSTVIEQRSRFNNLPTLLEEVRSRLRSPLYPKYIGNIQALEPIKSAMLTISASDLKNWFLRKDADNRYVEAIKAGTCDDDLKYARSIKVDDIEKRIAHALASHEPTEPEDLHPWNFEQAL